ncbi:MAG: ATP-binding protein [Gammaproteobacteria bacterium]|nr:ATP-binding protein [Gammaproteobacteria bacterium]
MRSFSTLVLDSLTLFPAAILLGPRQVGKSTLAKSLIKEGVLDRYITLDDLTTLTAARQDPDGFIESLSGRVVIDEIQRVPDLMRALKKRIDEHPQNGQFLLTGSANILTHKETTESLAGRMEVLNLEGLSLAESQGLPLPHSLQIMLETSLENFKAYLESLRNTITPSAKSLIMEAVFLGGFPQVALSRNEKFAARYFQAYQTTYIEKDVRDFAKGLDMVSFARCAQAFLSQSGQLLNVKSVSTDLGIDQRTCKRYLELLEMTFQVIALKPWFVNSLKSLIKMPKVYARDSGLATFMHRILNKEQLPQSTYFGALFETFIFAELRKQFHLTPGVSCFFYRTHQGKEVDFVLEYGDRLFGVEVKSAASVSPRDFGGLKDLEAARGKPLNLGVVLYQGEEIIYFAKNLWAVPVKYMLFPEKL